MSVLYLSEQYATARLDGDTVLVTAAANPTMGRENAYKKRLPLGKITQVVIFGQVTLTTGLIENLLERQVEIVYLTRFGKFLGRTSGREHKHSQLRLLQRRAHDDASTMLYVAKVCVRSKLHNQRTLLLRGNRTRSDAFIREQADAIGAYIAQIDALPMEETMPDLTQPQKGSVYGVLMGLEGAAAAAYFPAYRALLAEEWQAVFFGRHKRPPTDAVNALLSFGYTLLINQTAAAAQVVGFDPYIGYLHSSQYGKPALALDIVEMFRAPVVDSVVLTLLNNRMLTLEDFEETMGAWRMHDAARKTFLIKYEERLNTEIEHPVFKTKVTYRRCVELQMRLLSRWLLGELKRFRGFAVR